MYTEKKYLGPSKFKDVHRIFIYLNINNCIPFEGEMTVRMIGSACPCFSTRVPFTVARIKYSCFWYKCSCHATLTIFSENKVMFRLLPIGFCL